MADTSAPSSNSFKSPDGSSSPRVADRAADAVWRRLAEGHSAPWLDDIRTMRYKTDDFETSLDIWTVALTAELKNPVRRETASRILRRLITLAEGTETESAALG